MTVIPAEEHDLKLKAHQYWRDILGGFAMDCGACTNCSNLTDRCPGVSEKPGACDIGSDDLAFNVIDAAVLPIIRAQLEQKLSEVLEAEKAVAKATGGG
jgi:hypothetical protein